MRSTFAMLSVVFLMTLACSMTPDARQQEEDKRFISQVPIETNFEPDMTVTSSFMGDWWKPSIGMTWQWQLDQPIDLSINVEVYDVDLFETDPGTLEILKSKGGMLICYVSVGSWEEWRPDAKQFPADVLGKKYEGWPGEKWLDIRQIDELSPILRDRFDACKAQGFDGIEPDNMDGYSNDTGFPLTYADQLAFNLWLAQEAHQRGLSIGMKNDPEQVADLLPYFDWALTEDCFAEGWCEEMLPFIQAGKPVFAAEYTDMNIALEDICPQAKIWSISTILKNRELDAYMEDCR